MRDHLFKSFSLAESRYPNCAFIIVGDFNHLDVKLLKRQFRPKQTVKKLSRKDAILDLMLTNLHEFYDDSKIFPPFGLSDHNTITAQAKNQENRSTTKFVLKQESHKGRYLNVIDWPSLLTPHGNCEDLLNTFSEVIYKQVSTFLCHLKRCALV